MDFLKSLKNTVSEWTNGNNTDEWLLADFIKDVIGSMTPEEAFDNIGKTSDFLISQPDESSSIAILEIILALASRSDTSEMPHELHEKLNSISERFQNFGDYAKLQLDELFRYYRIK